MPYYNRDPKRDHNFDHHPYKVYGRESRMEATILVAILGQYRDNGKQNGNYFRV